MQQRLLVARASSAAARAGPSADADQQAEDEPERASGEEQGEHGAMPGSDSRHGHASGGPARRAGSVVRRVSLSIGIVGLPNVGKSTLFNALTKNDVLAANYPFATIEPNVGVVGVPDPRLAELAELFGSAEDHPGDGDVRRHRRHRQGRQRGRRGWATSSSPTSARRDAICQVIRVFDDPDVVARRRPVVAGDDIETINTELILADLQTLEKALPRLEKEARIKKDKAGRSSRPCSEAQKVLDAGQHAVRAPGSTSAPLRELHLLTAKPFLYVFNLDEDELGDEAPARRAARRSSRPAEAIFLDAKIEAELIELPDDEALELLQSIGQEESGLHQLARVGFDTLGLQTYLTAGPKEARAWTIRKGATAPEAAGVIHTDFQRGFIKAEIVSLRRPRRGRLE